MLDWYLPSFISPFTFSHLTYHLIHHHIIYHHQFLGSLEVIHQETKSWTAVQYIENCFIINLGFGWWCDEMEMVVSWDVVVGMVDNELMVIWDDSGWLMVDVHWVDLSFFLFHIKVIWWQDGPMIKWDEWWERDDHFYHLPSTISFHFCLTIYHHHPINHLIISHLSFYSGNQLCIEL